MRDDDDYSYDPYDDDCDSSLDCEHDNYEIDVCTGRAECDSCSKSWYVSNDEVDAELDRQARYHDDMERENRRQWWRDLFAPILDPLRALKWKFQGRRTRRVTDLDDEIPF